MELLYPALPDARLGLSNPEVAAVSLKFARADFSGTDSEAAVAWRFDMAKKEMQ